MNNFANDSEKLSNNYQNILSKTLIKDECLSSESDDEIIEHPDTFKIEYFISHVNDKIKYYLEYNIVYLCIRSANKSFETIRTNITSMNLEIGSNCCLLMSIGFDPIKLKNKKHISKSKMTVYVKKKMNTKDKSRKFIQITNSTDDVMSHDLVIHEPNQEKEKVSFTIVSDLDVSETSIWCKVGYLDYFF